MAKMARIGKAHHKSRSSNFSVPMTQDELSDLEAIAEKYLDEKGVMYGFVSYLLEGGRE